MVRQEKEGGHGRHSRFCAGITLQQYQLLDEVRWRRCRLGRLLTCLQSSKRTHMMHVVGAACQNSNAAPCNSQCAEAGILGIALGKYTWVAIYRIASYNGNSHVGFKLARAC